MQLRQQTITRNLRSNVIVLSSDPKGTDVIEWQPAGDPNGGDVQVIPDSILLLPAFTRLIARGLVAIEEADDETKAALGKQTAAFERRMNGAAQQAAEVIDREENKDILSIPCIGPDSRGTGTCGDPVPVREKTKDDTPALCSTHTPLAGQYVQHEEQVGTKVEKKWSRVVVTARERQQA